MRQAGDSAHDNRPLLRLNWLYVLPMLVCLVGFSLVLIWGLYMVDQPYFKQLQAGTARSGLSDWLLLVVVNIMMLAMAGSIAVVVPHVFLSLRLSPEGIYVPSLFGHQFLRWSEIVRFRLGPFPVVYLWVKENPIGVNLLFFQSPEQVIEEISKRVPAEALK